MNDNVGQSVMAFSHIGVLGIEENGVLGIKNHMRSMATDSSRFIKKQSWAKLKISFLLKAVSLSLAMTNRSERASNASLAHCSCS